MNRNRNDYEPIIAERRSRRPMQEDVRPLWHLVLALGAGLVLVALLALWWMDRSSGDDASVAAPSEAPAPEVFPEERIEETVLPPARGLETAPDVAQAPEPPVPAAEPVPSAEQAATPESAPEGAPVADVPAPPAPVSVRFMSPDPQVRFELRGPLESSTPVTSSAGDVVALAPGNYQVVASGSQLEPFEQDVAFDGERALEYTVELCAQRELERESLAGEVVEEQACGSTEQCESMFMVLSEQASELLRDGSFRTQQCAKWRPTAAPEGKWTLDIECGGATLATMCRIEIGEGVCTFAGPRRSARGGECPRAELNQAQ